MLAHHTPNPLNLRTYKNMFKPSGSQCVGVFSLISHLTASLASGNRKYDITTLTFRNVGMSGCLLTLRGSQNSKLEEHNMYNSLQQSYSSHTDETLRLGLNWHLSQTNKQTNYKCSIYNTSNHDKNRLNDCAIIIFRICEATLLLVVWPSDKH